MPLRIRFMYFLAVITPGTGNTWLAAHALA